MIHILISITPYFDLQERQKTSSTHKPQTTRTLHSTLNTHTTQQSPIQPCPKYSCNHLPPPPPYNPSTNTTPKSLGATGYIGGDTLYALHEAHPDWEYCCLVRDSDKGALVAATYPKVRLVYGDLSSEDVIQKAAGEADVVLSESL